MVSVERVRELLDYDPGTGVFTWRVRRGGADTGGRPVGRKDGYIRIGIDGVRHYAHRLAFLYCFGFMPNEVDHKNGNTSDNRLSNLRMANRQKNSANSRINVKNTSGFKGVCKTRSKLSPWEAAIMVDKRRIYLGSFSTAESAHSAYRAAADKYFGSFARYE